MSARTREVADFAAGLTLGALPDAVVARVKLLLLDSFGIMIRARHDAESTESLIAAVETLGLADGACRVAGDQRGYAPPAAALINGTLAHSLDFDDTHAEASLHACAPVIPAALAAAEMRGQSGAALICAIVAGFEIQVRLALAVGPKDHYDQGFHPTATCGVFAAAAAAGRLFALDASAIENAFGLALSQAAGSMRFLLDGAWSKRSHVGQAAQNGLIAAALAAAGYKGPMGALEGRWGFLETYGRAPEPARLTAALGEHWQTLNLALKPYPCCRYSHAALDALVALKERHELDVAAVDAVEIGLSETGRRLVGEPEADKQAPQGVVAGQFSMPFCAAVALREGGLAWDHYARHLTDPETLALCRKVRTVTDAEAEAAYPGQMSARARIKTGGQWLEYYVAVPLGEPENFISDAALRQKFDSLTAPYLDAGRRDALVDAVANLDQTGDATALLRLSA